VSAQTAAEEEKIYTDAFVGDRSWNGRERNQLLRNRGDGAFVEVGAALGLDGIADARGLAGADFDRDGDVDFLINNYRARAALYDNRLGTRKAWIALRVQGTRSNRDGVGAVVTVRTEAGRQTRVVGAGHGYASQNSLEQVFGLGDALGVSVVVVRWPGGVREAFGPFDAGQRLVLVEGSGRPAKSDRSAPRPIRRELRVAPARNWMMLVPVLLVGALGLVLIRR
jgi:hypothetical protein